MGRPAYCCGPFLQGELGDLHLGKHFQATSKNSKPEAYSFSRRRQANVCEAVQGALYNSPHAVHGDGIFENGLINYLLRTLYLFGYCK